jgi:hypothetical protein
MNARCRNTAVGRISVGLLPLVLPVILCVLNPARMHAAIDDSVPAPAYIAQLEQRAAQAKPREQCFLYAELVHGMTQLARKQLLDGDAEAASATLKQISHYAQLIHKSLASDTKKVKDAEMLMQHTTSHLGMYIRGASSDDQAALRATLVQLDHVHEELLTQVFTH